MFVCINIGTSCILCFLVDSLRVYITTRAFRYTLSENRKGRIYREVLEALALNPPILKSLENHKNYLVFTHKKLIIIINKKNTL